MSHVADLHMNKSKEALLTQFGSCVVPIIVLFFVVWTYRCVYLQVIGSGKPGSSPAYNLTLPDVKVGQSQITKPDEAIALNNVIYANRQCWCFATATQICVCAGVTLISLFLLWNALEGVSEKGLVVVAILLTIMTIVMISGKDGNYLVFRQLAAKTIDAHIVGNSEKITDLVIAIDKFSFATALLLACVTAATLIQVPSTGIDAVQSLAQQIQILRTALYLGTLVLISGIVFWTASYNWAASYTQLPSRQIFESISTLTQSSTLGRGMYYSMLLSATYIPAATIHRARALVLLDVAMDRAKEPDASEWLKQHGIAVDIWDFAPKIAAILAPLLTGPLIDIVRSVTA